MWFLFYFFDFLHMENIFKKKKKVVDNTVKFDYAVDDLLFTSQWLVKC